MSLRLAWLAGLLVAAAWLAFFLPAAFAQTPQQIAACALDAKTLCNPSITDAFNHRRICGCMAVNYLRLSEACRAVVPFQGLRQCAAGK